MLCERRGHRVADFDNKGGNRMRGIALVLALLLSSSALAADKAEQQRKEIQKMEKDVVTRLYSVQPSAKRAIEGAAGYAVFSNFGMKILFAGGGSGKGVAVDRKSGQRTYMKMGEIQAGAGIGVKKFQVVFVFETADNLNAFVNQGWEFGGQTTAAATSGDKGAALQGALSVSPGVWMYQLTDKGLALEATVKGTKYWKDADLNGA
jgi:lipid-binding SYLF domain-containing protein